MRLLIICVFILAVASLAVGQDCTSYVVVNAYNHKLAFDLVTLKAGDFEARMGSTPLSIVSSEQNYKTRLLVLVEVDRSGDDARIGEVVDTVTKMARQAPDGQPVAFGVYAGKAVFTKGFFADPDERDKAISVVREEANSLGKRVAMLDSLREALKLFGPHQPGDAVLLVGFPYDDRSSHSAGEVEKLFLESGTRLMTMLRAPMSSNSRDFLFNSHTPEKNLFLEFPEKTGGAHSHFDSHFFGWNWRGYLLEVKVSGGKSSNEPKKWKLKFRGVA
ncbi:MAG TPA: hypothetical protein VJ723_04210, partial [Candidatus Angelobacter sp.]|nr:hypothetical protein [Candidatus Angelobacter sp.]